MSLPADDLSLALKLADLADAITVARFRAEDLEVETKPDMTPVTEADTAVERIIRDQLAAARPEDSVVGEEFGDSGHGARRWILDPIDGTKNYVRGIPVWGTLLALQENGTPSVGVVSAPALHRRWWAARGAGAFLDDGLSPAPRRLHVSAIRDLADAQLTLSELEEWDDLGRLDDMLRLARSCWRSRGFGDFWGYMLVAEGVVDVAVEPVVLLWDLAAPQVIVEEAGGRFTDLAGIATADGGDGLATNGRLHDAALAIIGREAASLR